MSTSTTRRIDLASLAGAPATAMVKLEERIELDPRLRELVRPGKPGRRQELVAA
jgi:hypothetical protein